MNFTSLVKQWDNSFPYLPGVGDWIYGTSRIYVFRSESEWLLALVLFVYHLGLGDFANIVYISGNRVKKGSQSDVWSNPTWVPRTKSKRRWGFGSPIGREKRIENNKRNNVAYITVQEPKHDEPTWCPNPLDFELTLRDQRQSKFRLTVADYLASGEDLGSGSSSEDDCLNNLIHIIHILPDILPKDDLIVSANILLSYVKEYRSSRSVLRKFLELETWKHPGISENPSSMPCFQSLALAIEKNDPNLYQCPEKLHNTHWSHWPPFGETIMLD